MQELRRSQQQDARTGETKERALASDSGSSVRVRYHSDRLAKPKKPRSASSGKLCVEGASGALQWLQQTAVSRQGVGAGTVMAGRPALLEHTVQSTLPASHVSLMANAAGDKGKEEQGAVGAQCGCHATRLPTGCVAALLSVSSFSL